MSSFQITSSSISLFSASLLERAVVLLVEEALDVDADHLGAVRDVVEPVALDDRGRADALERPVVDAARGSLG